MDKEEDPAIRRLKWVKKKVEETDKGDLKDKWKKDQSDDVRKGDKTKPGKIIKKKPTTKDDYEEEDVVQPTKKVITEADIEKEANEIANHRGQLERPIEIVARIENLLTLTDNVFLKIKLLNLDILLCFDTSPGQFSALSIEMWQNIYDSINELLNNYYKVKSTQPDQNNEAIVIL